VALLAYLPLLLIGVVLYGRVGVSSQTDGMTALRRIADNGALFAITNAVFHLGALLLIPAAVAIVLSLRDDTLNPWSLLGSTFLFLAVAVGAGFVFSLGQGLVGVASAFSGASPEAQQA
jgi:hypothetical protein